MQSAAAFTVTLSCLLAAATASGAPAQSWVRAAPSMAAANTATAGYLLHDRQIRITADGDDRYEHTILRVPASQISEHSARIDLELDPRYQEIVIHVLRLTHDGQPTLFSDAQIRAQTRTQASEAEAHKRDLDPRQQLSVQIPGVQPGDLLECEYTVSSHASRFAGLFVGHYAAQWTSGADLPVWHERLLVSWPATRHLQYRLSGGSARTQPTVVSRAGELDVEWRNLVPGVPEPDTPGWFDRRGTVQLSDFEDWQQVSTLLAPQYARPSEEPPDTPGTLDQPTQPAAPGLILNALHLVQSKVHALYLGGDGPYLPAAPTAVLQRGYGDSRDLARLLVALLRRVGIDAQVALADGRGVPLDTHLPSPFMLDAALVVARAGTTEYWINPAVPGPSEVLGTTDPAELHRALLIAATQGRIVALPRPAPDSRLRTIEQQFDLRGGNTRPAALTVTTEFRGLWAQAVRNDLLAQTPAQRQLSQIQGVAQDYPSAVVDGEVEIRDVPDRPMLRLTQRFRIPTPFGTGPEPHFNFFAEALSDAVQARDEPTREFPLSLPWPLQLEEHIDAELPPDFEVRTGELVIENPAFRYVREISLTRGALRIFHSYVLLSDHVAPADYPRFIAANAQVYQALGVSVLPRGFSWHQVTDWLGRHLFALCGAAAVLAAGAAGWRRWQRG